MALSGLMHIYVTRKIPSKGIELLKEAGFSLTINPEDRVPSLEELKENLRECDGLLCLLTDPISAELMDAAPNLKVIANYAVGFNNIAVDEATKRGIFVCNTPDVLTHTTAEHAWALLFATARRIVEGDHFTRNGSFHGWGPLVMIGHDVYKKTLGVVGSGRIGSAFALKSRGFDMEVLYYNRTPNEELESSLDAKKVSLDELLKRSDFVSIHLPLTDQTKHLIGKRELSLMKKSAILINTARGPIIDEEALIAALKNNSIAGAGLDVYEHEPTIPDSLKSLDNVVLQPHSGSASIDTRQRMSAMAAENIIAALKGERPPNCVNPEVFE